MLPILLAPTPSKFLAFVNDKPIPIKVAIDIIQKNFDAKEDKPELLSATASKFDVRNSEIYSAPRCDKPTVPKAIANRTI